MIIYQAIKIRLYPNKEQKYFIDNTIGACRYIYNYMLQRNTIIYKRRKEYLSRYDMQKLLPLMKGYLPWLKEVDSKALCFSCKILDDAFKSFYKKKNNFPKFKSKKEKQTYTTTWATYLDKDKYHIQLPCLRHIKCHGKRKLPEGYKICNATISKETDGNYYCSISYKYEANIKPRIINSTNAIGLDFQIKGLYVDSNNNTLDFPKWYQNNLKKLAKEQRKLKNKCGNRKGEIKSNNYKKQQIKIFKLHRHIANQRKDYLHKQSTAIAKQYSVVCIEDLSIKEMILRPKDTHCRKLRLNTNRSYLNNGWYMFTEMLGYKLNYSGGQLIRIDKNFKSTETCNCCGNILETKLKITKKSWICPVCKTKHNRDYNAAINIKNEGIKHLNIL